MFSGPDDVGIELSCCGAKYLREAGKAGWMVLLVEKRRCRAVSQVSAWAALDLPGRVGAANSRADGAKAASAKQSVREHASPEGCGKAAGKRASLGLAYAGAKGEMVRHGE